MKQSAVIEYDRETDIGVIKVPIEDIEKDRPVNAELWFQNGMKGRNGLFNEDVILLLILRLRTLNQGELACRENSIAITKLEEALMWLERRAATREQQGVSGTMQPHEEV